jgi:hypothetical protein
MLAEGSFLADITCTSVCVEGVLSVFAVPIFIKNIQNFKKPCFDHVIAFVLRRHDTKTRKSRIVQYSV